MFSPTSISTKSSTFIESESLGTTNNQPSSTDVYAGSGGAHSVSDTWITLQSYCAATDSATIPVFACTSGNVIDKNNKNDWVAV